MSDRAVRAFVPAKVGAVWLMVDAGAVQEIIGARACGPMPGAAPPVAGVIPWRGRAVAVFDLATVTSSAESLVLGSSRPRTIIASADGCMLAMPVEAVREVQEIDEALVQPASRPGVRHCADEVSLFGEVAPVLSLSALVASVTATGESAEGDASSS